MNNGEFAPRITTDINGVETALIILEDPAYPLLPQLMKPFTGYLDEEGNCLTISSIVAEWQWSMYLSISKLNSVVLCLEQNWPWIIGVCCILYNTDESQGGNFDNGLEAEVQRLAQQSEQPLRCPPETKPPDQCCENSFLFFLWVWGLKMCSG